MNIKMIICDVDNTLLNDDGQLEEQNRLAINELRQKGVQFILASGRSLKQLERTMCELGIVNQEGEYTISLNGGTISENKKNRMIATSHFDYHDVQQLLDFAAYEHFCVHIQTDHMLYLLNPSQSEIDYLAKIGQEYVIMKENQRAYLKNEKVGKVLFHCNDLAYLKDIAVNVDIYCDAKLSISFSANKYMEINPGEIHKGNALKLISNYLKIPLTEILAIGDNHNDVEMLKVAGYAACPSNGVQEVKAISNYIAKNDNNHCAIHEILNQLVLEKVR